MKLFLTKRCNQRIILAHVKSPTLFYANKKYCTGYIENRSLPLQGWNGLAIFFSYFSDGHLDGLPKLPIASISNYNLTDFFFPPYETDFVNFVD